MGTSLVVWLVCLSIYGVLASPLRAESIVNRPYAELLRELDSREGFEAWPMREEPGHLLRAPHRAPGLAVASHFEGQSPGILTRRDGGRHDSLVATQADAPLRLATGPDGQGLAVARHRGLGSNAAFPIGPDGFGLLSGRGEGSLAILFDQDQRATGMLIHSDYPDPLGSRPAPRGRVEVIFLARDGRVLGQINAALTEGVTALGFQTAGGLPQIAGVVILNTDPGGIAVDDILFARAALMGRAATPDNQAPAPVLAGRGPRASVGAC
ncbi:MAG: hypothetical protein NWT12_06385 [Paracoccaceae bacterium]|nr:hypothetical protein [Paracoccaceae bacterium]MDP5365902.1 hypothetical protein [Paracoccaceae bacterium]